jgi:hypothetical protein
MKLVYIAAPLTPIPDEVAREARAFPDWREDWVVDTAREANRWRASRWCAWAARQGVSPVATWIVLSGQWGESPENRALGLACDLAAVERCDEVWLVGGRVSPGMRAEAAHAEERGLPVRDLTHMGEEPPK